MLSNSTVGNEFSHVSEYEQWPLTVKSVPVGRFINDYVRE